jgi:hypothetical protein
VADLPHRNENTFYRYPLHRVVTVIDDEKDIETALSRLDGIGIDRRQIVVLSGPQGAKLLDSSGKKHGLHGRLLRFLQQGAYEGDVLHRHEAALNRGASVVYVPVRGDRQQSQVADVLRASGGSGLDYFGRWSITDL